MRRSLALVLSLSLFVPLAARAEEEDVRSQRHREDAGSLRSDAPVDARIPPQRYLYAGAGVFLIGGLGLSYWANGEAVRAEGLASARETERSLRNARTSAATANLMFALAGVTLAYGLVLELLPEQTAENADLTFHF